LDSFNSTNTYFQKISKLFNIKTLKKSELGILIIPSFEPEIFVILNNNSIKFQRTKENFWYSKSDNVEIIENQKVKNNILYRQLKDFTDTSKKRTIKKLVLDGTKHYVFRPNNQQIEVMVFDNPDEKSKAGNFIIELNKLIKSI
jgi:hypothetical protein